MSTASNNKPTARRPDAPARFDSGVKHNPKPSTERGKRRHAARNDEQKKHAEKAWGSA